MSEEVRKMTFWLLVAIAGGIVLGVAGTVAASPTSPIAAAGVLLILAGVLDGR